MLVVEGDQAWCGLVLHETAMSTGLHKNRISSTGPWPIRGLQICTLRACWFAASRWAFAPSSRHAQFCTRARFEKGIVVGTNGNEQVSKPLIASI
jgi:hypothetical protein